MHTPCFFCFFFFLSRLCALPLFLFFHWISDDDPSRPSSVLHFLFLPREHRGPPFFFLSGPSPVKSKRPTLLPFPTIRCFFARFVPPSLRGSRENHGLASFFFLLPLFLSSLFSYSFNSFPTAWLQKSRPGSVFFCTLPPYTFLFPLTDERRLFHS